MKPQRRRKCLEARITERETGLEALLQAPSTATVDSTSTTGFRSNKAFDTLPIFSGEQNQPFGPRYEVFISKAGIVGVHHDSLRELRMTLTSTACAHCYQRYTDHDVRADVSDAHLQCLTGAPDETRRE